MPSLEDKRKAIPDDVLLSVDNLKQYFKIKRNALKAVDGVSFDVKKGEVFGIVGESGCGKTTTGRSIIGLYDITGGDVFFEDKLINTGLPERQREIEEASRSGDHKKASELKDEYKKAVHEMNKNRKAIVHQNIQMIFQDPVSSLDPRMTIREIVSEGLIIQGEKNKKVIHDKVTKVLNQVGLLEEHADRYPHEFSGGQRQRIGIARAIIMEPKLIIADEPVSALDVSIQAQVINLLNELRESMDLTLIFIAHDLSVVKYFSDRIAVMYYGKIVELTTSDELFSHPCHPYTRALLSAIPSPDPLSEKTRERFHYIPAAAHDYSVEGPTLREVSPGHYVSCNSAEEERYKRDVFGL